MRMKYVSSLLGRWQDMPGFEWNEFIALKDHQSREWWLFSNNMYKVYPGSATLAIWPQRYINAYRTAHGEGLFCKGETTLFKLDGNAVTRAELGTAVGPAARADLVIAYLKKHGGIMEITIHDVPSLALARDGRTVNKERLLSFNCGVAGSTRRYRGWQHLRMDSTLIPGDWTRLANPGSDVPDMDTSGLKKVEVPENVGNAKAAVPFPGEYY